MTYELKVDKFDLVLTSIVTGIWAGCGVWRGWVMVFPTGESVDLPKPRLSHCRDRFSRVSREKRLQKFKSRLKLLKTLSLRPHQANFGSVWQHLRINPSCKSFFPPCYFFIFRLLNSDFKRHSILHQISKRKNSIIMKGQFSNKNESPFKK